MTSPDSNKKTRSNFIFNGQKKEFLDWLESLRISKYWLDTLSTEDSYALCKEIFEVLKHFKQLELIPKERLFALIEIYGCLKDLCEKLQETYLNSPFPLSDDHQRYANLISSIYLALAKAYYEIIGDTSVDRLSKKHITLAICRAFQALIFSLSSSLEVYKSVPNNFWALCYHLYSNANIFTVVASRIKMDEKISSPELLLKQLLILYIIDAYQLTPSEIREFTLYSRTIAHYVDLKHGNAEELNKAVGFYFEKNDPPKYLNPETSLQTKTLRFINIGNIVKAIQFIIYEKEVNSSKPELNVELLQLITQELVNRQKHKSQLEINKEYHCHALIGIYNIIDFLLEKEEKTETERYRIEKSDLKSQDREQEEMDSLQLMLDWDEDGQKIDKPQNNILVDGLSIIGSNIEGYQLFWNKKSGIQLQIGQVIGIIPDFRTSRNRVEIGIIRKININNDGIKFNVELLGLESTLIKIEKDNSFEASEWELFLFGSPKYDVSILCNQEHQYNAGENISVLLGDKKIPCKLGEILNSTPLVSHIRLSYL